MAIEFCSQGGTSEGFRSWLEGRKAISRPRLNSGMACFRGRAEQVICGRFERDSRTNYVRVGTIMDLVTLWEALDKRMGEGMAGGMGVESSVPWEHTWQYRS
ncbi:MAG: hypothetical protein MRJ68_11360 [Nitrospira sp.]|nr:hypothetical protein [Nitrospira sp.]